MASPVGPSRSKASATALCRPPGQMGLPDEKEDCAIFQSDPRIRLYLALLMETADTALRTRPHLASSSPYSPLLMRSLSAPAIAARSCGLFLLTAMPKTSFLKRGSPTMV